MSVVEIAGAGKNFDRRRALVDVSASVEQGEIVGLLGPNGSGKTTLLKLLAGFLKPTSGHVTVFGFFPFRQQPSIMRQAQFVFAPPALYDSLSALEHVRFLASLNGGQVAEAPCRDVLRLVGLEDRRNDRVRTFSFGMRQRLALAMSLLPRPRLLVLDEPTDGLDPLAILELRDILRDLRTHHGLSILLSSHLLVEIEKLVDRVLVLNEGRSLFWGRPEELTREHAYIQVVTSDPREATKVLQKHGFSVATRKDGSLRIDSDHLTLEQTRELLRQQDIQLHSFHRHRPGLEDALLQALRSSRGGVPT